jgi:hypothetical protein
MLIFKSSKNGSMSDIPISTIEAGIKREFVLDKAEALIGKLHDMNYGNTEHRLKDEDGIYSGGYGIYAGDVAAIFSLLKIPVKFIDVNGKVLAVDGSGSGIYC